MNAKHNLIKLITYSGKLQAVKLVILSLVKDLVNEEGGFHQMKDLYIEFTDEKGYAKDMQVQNIVINVAGELLLFGLDDSNGNKLTLQQSDIDLDALNDIAFYIIEQLTDSPKYAGEATLSDLPTLDSDFMEIACDLAQKSTWEELSKESEAKEIIIPNIYDEDEEGNATYKEYVQNIFDKHYDRYYAKLLKLTKRII